jgi:cation diffusion facilitator family transporter
MSGHHHHDIDDEESESKTRLVVIITLVMMVIEISAGLFTKSMGLLADGWHMGTHAAALGITLYAYYFARTESKVKDSKDKVMALGGFASAIVLGIVALYIGWESIGRILEPEKIQFQEAIIVAIIGLIVNLACANILGIENHDHHGHDHEHTHDHSHEQVKKESSGGWATVASAYTDDWKFILGKFDNFLTNPNDIEDLNRRGAYLHVLADALVSVMVIMALIIGMFNTNFTILDPLIGIVAGLVITRWAWGLLIESRNQILGID